MHIMGGGPSYLDTLELKKKNYTFSVLLCSYKYFL